MEDANLGSMSHFEVDAHSFVVRLWRENSDTPQRPSQWRGRVDHVQSGQRRYFQDLAEIPQIITSFTDEEDSIDNLFEPWQPPRQEP